MAKIEIKGGILDKVHKTLDKTIWDIEKDPPILLGEVKQEILKRLFEELRRRNLRRFDLWIKDIFFIGSMVTLQFTETSDIDIMVIIDEKRFSEHNPEKLNVKEFFKEISKLISGKYYGKTLHIINYNFKIYPQKVIADAIYDIIADKWIKIYPQLISEFEPDEFFSEFRDKARMIMNWVELVRVDIRASLIDIQLLQELLNELDRESQQKVLDEIRKKVIKIEKEILELTSIYDSLIEARDKAFQLDEYDELGFLAYKFSSNWLPPNIVYKFLERYNYLDLLHKIKKIVKENKLDIETLKDVFLK